MLLKTKIFLAAFFMLASAVCAQEFDKAKLDKFFDRLNEKNKAMGSLLIARDGNVVYARSIGYAQIDGAQKKPLTESSRFRIASITKMYTATMILQLVEEQKLKLTDTLDKFFPEVPNAPKITIQQLLNHRSGIPNVRRDREAQRDVHTTPITKEETLALIVKAAPLFEPDAQFRYSNSGYFLLGWILEKVTGKSYQDALKERITGKIGLNDTYMATGNIDVSKNESLTYLYFGGEWKQMNETHPSVLFGGGAIISTTSDMVRFIKALFDGKLISRETLAAMKTMRDGYGLGMEAVEFGGKTFYGHGGGGDNYGAWLAYEPEGKVAVAYGTNAKVYPVMDILRGALDIYYGKAFVIPTFEGVALSAEVLDRYVGVYVTADAPAKFTVKREGTTLYVQPPGVLTGMAVEAVAENKFRLEGVGATFEFDAANGQLKVKRPNGERTFTKEK